MVVYSPLTHFCANEGFLLLTIAQVTGLNQGNLQNPHISASSKKWCILQRCGCNLIPKRPVFNTLRVYQNFPTKAKCSFCTCDSLGAIRDESVLCLFRAVVCSWKRSLPYHQWAIVMSSVHIMSYFNHRTAGKHTWKRTPIQKRMTTLHKRPLVTRSWCPSAHPDLAQGSHSWAQPTQPVKVRGILVAVMEPGEEKQPET